MAYVLRVHYDTADIIGGNKETGCLAGKTAHQPLHIVFKLEAGRSWSHNFLSVQRPLIATEQLISVSCSYPSHSAYYIHQGLWNSSIYQVSSWSTVIEKGFTLTTSYIIDTRPFNQRQWDKSIVEHNLAHLINVRKLSLQLTTFYSNFSSMYQPVKGIYQILIVLSLSPRLHSHISSPKFILPQEIINSLQSGY